MNAPTPDEAAALLRVAEQQLDLWKAECRALEAERDALRAEVERARDREQAVRALADRLAKADSDTYSFGSWSIVRDIADRIRHALGSVETPQEDNR